MILGFTPEQAEAEITQLSDLLTDAVHRSLQSAAFQRNEQNPAAFPHRGHRRARRRGLARALMVEVESTALKLGRTLLFMNTRKDGAAHRMCEALGYTRAGEIPNYARSADGQLHTTVFFYKQR